MPSSLRLAVAAASMLHLVCLKFIMFSQVQIIFTFLALQAPLDDLDDYNEPNLDGWCGHGWIIL
jgi:hypothetical protein